MCRIGRNRRERSPARQSRAEAVFGIHVQDANGGASDRREADEQAAIPREVCFPWLVARIEKRNDLPGLRVDAGEVCALVQIAGDAGEREISRVVTASVLPRQDVLDLESGDGRLRLGPLAILAPIAGALADEQTRLLIDHDARSRRALAWSTAMKSFAST